MKQTPFIIAFFLIFNSLSAQNVYENYTQNDTTGGDKLILGTNSLNYQRTVAENRKSLYINLNAKFLKWKFTPKNLFLLKTEIHNDFQQLSSDENSFPNVRVNSLYTDVFGGISHYLQPNKFYGNLSTKLTYTTNSGDFQQNYNSGNGYLFGAIGYGRINNAQGLEAAEYFSEALLRTKVITKPLDKNTLLALDKIIYKYRNGSYSDYKDDAEIYLMKHIERVLMEHNAISGRLDAENTMRLFTIFTNNSQKYYFYPRYIGFQTQAEVQYHLFSDVKPKENFAKVSALYGLPLTRSSNLLLSALYAQSINDDAGVYLQYVPPYLITGYSNTDINNFSFTSNDYLFGNSNNSVIPYGSKSIMGISANVTHSLSSTAGLFLMVSYYNYAAKSDILPSDSRMMFNTTLSFDYNIYSKLFSRINLGYYKDEVYAHEIYSVGLSFNYAIF